MKDVKDHLTRMGLCGVVLALSACASPSLEGDKIDYKSATKGSTLEVPPDLTQLSRQSSYGSAGGITSASAFQADQAQQRSSGTAAAAQTAVLSVGDVHIERNGNQRWLVVKRSSEALWEPVRQFWLDSGFIFTQEQPKLGLLETDWAENRAKLPQDIIRQTIGKAFDALYSTGERDKFRTRLERTAEGVTEIYISHRGMEEVYSTAQKDSTMWQPRSTDIELENEFLRRLMVKLGASKEQAQTVMNNAAQRPALARALVREGAPPAVEIDEPFDRAWRRVGLSLDRSGFTVEDRDRSQGLYFVRYVAPADSTGKKEPGFFSKLFSSSESTSPPVKYRIAVQSAGDKSTVSVQNATGAPESSIHAERIVKLLAEDLK